jgi:hypothetical protein
MTQFVQLVLVNLPMAAQSSLAGKRAARGAALFVMGGTSELLRAVLSGSLGVPLDELIDRLTAMWVSVLA